MGYAHYYEIDIEDDLNEEILKELCSVNDDLADALIDGNDTRVPIIEEYIVSFSKKYPDTLFTVTSAGEIPFDIVRTYILNGKMEDFGYIFPETTLR